METPSLKTVKFHYNFFDYVNSKHVAPFSFEFNVHSFIWRLIKTN